MIRMRTRMIAASLAVAALLLWARADGAARADDRPTWNPDGDRPREGAKPEPSPEAELGRRRAEADKTKRSTDRPADREPGARGRDGDPEGKPRSAEGDRPIRETVRERLQDNLRRTAQLREEFYAIEDRLRETSDPQTRAALVRQLHAKASEAFDLTTQQRREAVREGERRLEEARRRLEEARAQLKRRVARREYYIRKFLHERLEELGIPVQEPHENAKDKGDRPVQ